MDEILFVGVQLLAYALLINTGKVLVFVLTFGQWRCERLLKDERKKFLRAGSLIERVDGKILVRENGQAILGALFYCGLLVWFFVQHAT